MQRAPAWPCHCASDPPDADTPSVSEGAHGPAVGGLAVYPPHTRCQCRPALCSQAKERCHSAPPGAQASHCRRAKSQRASCPWTAQLSARLGGSMQLKCSVCKTGLSSIKPQGTWMQRQSLFRRRGWMESLERDPAPPTPNRGQTRGTRLHPRSRGPRAYLCEPACAPAGGWAGGSSSHTPRR